MRFLHIMYFAIGDSLIHVAPGEVGAPAHQSTRHVGVRTCRVILQIMIERDGKTLLQFLQPCGSPKHMSAVPMLLSACDCTPVVLQRHGQIKRALPEFKRLRPHACRPSPVAIGRCRPLPRSPPGGRVSSNAIASATCRSASAFCPDFQCNRPINSSTRACARTSLSARQSVSASVAESRAAGTDW